MNSAESPGQPREETPPTHCPVLIVEDDEDLRDMMAQMLTIEGFNAATAANGREALDTCTRPANPT
jgi:CheY-like chemotaxis protein